MTIDRRQLLASAGVAAGIGVVPAAARTAPAQAAPAGALPMPAPGTALPDPLPVTDPSRRLLDRGWLFHEGDIVPAMPTTTDATYLSVKAGNAQGAAAIGYDDSDWQSVTLPHDWAAAQPVTESANVSQGFRARGIGWYRRTLRLDPADRGKRIELQFGGVASNATVWINGSVVAHGWSGYTSLYVDMTPFARFGDDVNVIVVRADASVREGWWYEGAGLYRHVWLAIRAPVSIATDGVHADPRRGGDGGWHVPVAVTLESVAADAADVVVEAALLAPDGAVLATQRAATTVPALEQAAPTLTLAAGAPALWSVAQPVLYAVRTRVLRGGAVVDERRTPIGFRTIRFDAARGALLNDVPIKLKGVCIHQDHAGVGVAVPDALLAWRLARLKAMGCNAIRCTHGAPAAEMLDLTDRMGFLVMDENRQFDPAPDYLAQLQWMVRRDRNHPSVILWSVFNEEPMQGTAAGVEMVRRMAHAVHALDDSRPVTAAMNGAFFEPANVSTVIDVIGFNYYQSDYDRYHALHPDKPMTSSEDTSAFETRGAYADDPARFVITSYDTEAAGWGATHRAAWAAIAARPFVAGGFVWTGFDYHGEPTPNAWPVVSSYFGAMDLCGFAKTAFDIHRAAWIDDAPVLALAPHWTWPGREGQPIQVFVTGNAERVALYLNGRLLGEQAADRLQGNSWTVPYAPGRLEAIGYRGGRAVAWAAHETTGAPVALRLTPARTVMRGDGEDVQPITIDAIDAQGRHVPVANLPARFAVTGASIIGLGNGDPTSHEPEKGDARSLFNGLAQMIVAADLGAGRIMVRATAPGLRPAVCAIARTDATPRAQAGVTAPFTALRGWRRSPVFAAAPDVAALPAAIDNNSWAFVQAGMPTAAEPAASWRVYRASVTPRHAVVQHGGTLVFAQVTGSAELWIDGRHVATKAEAAPGPLTAPIAPGAGERVVLLVVAARAGMPSGLTGAVRIEDTKL